MLLMQPFDLFLLEKKNVYACFPDAFILHWLFALQALSSCNTAIECPQYLLRVTGVWHACNSELPCSFPVVVDRRQFVVGPY